MNEEKKEGLSLAEFQPAREQLQKLADNAKHVDTSDIVAVHDARIELRDARTALTKKGKELREGAVQFQKKVINLEKELLGIITPEEDRLEVIENEHKLKAEMEKRRVELPTRIAALQSIGDGQPIDEETILKMDDAVFNEFRLSRIERKLQADKEATEAEQRRKDAEARAKLDAEKAEFERTKKAEEDRIRAENDKQNELRRAEEAKIAAEKAELAKEKARLEGIEQERKRAEAAAEAEKVAAEKAKAKAEADAEFKKWLESIGFNPETDSIMWSIDKTTAGVYRKIGTYKTKN